MDLKSHIPMATDPDPEPTLIGETPLPPSLSKPTKRSTTLNVRDDLGHLDSEAIADLYASTIGDEVQIICLNLSGDINIGSIIRTANLFGVGKIHLLGRRRYDKRGAVGHHKYVPTVYHPAMVGAHSEALQVDEAFQVLTKLLEDGTKVLVIVEQVEKAACLSKLNDRLSEDFPSKTPIFLFGNEGSGVPEELIALLLPHPSTLFVTIPQVGTGRSHNVSNAAAMVLWEYYRTRVS